MSQAFVDQDYGRNIGSSNKAYRAAPASIRDSGIAALTTKETDDSSLRWKERIALAVGFIMTIGPLFAAWAGSLYVSP
jgi:hypothetical protein